MASCPHTQVAVSGLLRRPCLAQGDSVGASTWTPTTRTHTLHTHVHIHTTHMYTVHMYTYHVHIHTTHKYMPQHVHSIHTMYTHVHTMHTPCAHHTHVHTTHICTQHHTHHTQAAVGALSSTCPHSVAALSLCLQLLKPGLCFLVFSSHEDLPGRFSMTVC